MWGEIMVDTVLLDNYIKRGSFSDKFVADSLNKSEVIELILKADDETIELIEHLLAGSILLP